MRCRTLLPDRMVSNGDARIVQGECVGRHCTKFQETPLRDPASRLRRLRTHQNRQDRWCEFTGRGSSHAAGQKNRKKSGFRWLAWMTCTVVLMACLETSMSSAGEPVVEVNAVQRLYDKQEYQKALDEIGKLSPSQAALADVRRVKVQSFLRLGNPKEALVEYDKLEHALKQDDIFLLREIALGFVLVLTKDMREQMRGVAYTALKDWQSPEAVPFLEDGLLDGSGLVRTLAAEGLAKLEKGRRSARFRQAIEDEAVLVKEAVLKGLGRSGDASVVALAEPAMEEPEVRVRVAAAEVLCRFGRKQGCESLEQSGRSPNPDERNAALRALVTMKGAALSSLLLEASRHKQPSVRGAAAMGLSHIPAPEAVAALVRLLKDPLPPVRVSAVVSLGQLQGVDTVSSLRTVLDDHDASVRAFVVGSLLAQGEPFDVVAAAISELSNAKSTAIRAALARALGSATGKNRLSARLALESLMADTIPRVRIAAIKSIAKLDGKNAVTTLKKSLHDTDDAVRAATGGKLLHAMLE